MSVVKAEKIDVEVSTGGPGDFRLDFLASGCVMVVFDMAMTVTWELLTIIVVMVNPLALYNRVRMPDTWRRN